MSPPKEREVRQVAKANPVMDGESRARLWTLLSILGFDHMLVALWWDPATDEDFVKRAFSDERGLTGAEFAWFCSQLHVRPGAVQQILNLDETKRPRRTGGTRAVKRVAAWQGFPVLCEHGHPGDGRIVADLCRQPSILLQIPSNRQPNTHTISQIACGNFPVGLQLLRDIVAAAKVSGMPEGRYAKLVEIIGQLPPGVKTADKIFASAEERRRDEMSEFAQAFQESGLGSDFQAVVNLDAGVANWIQVNLEIHPSDLEEIADGEYGVRRSELKPFIEEVERRGIRCPELDRLKNFLEENDPSGLVSTPEGDGTSAAAEPAEETSNGANVIETAPEPAPPAEENTAPSAEEDPAEETTSVSETDESAVVTTAEPEGFSEMDQKQVAANIRRLAQEGSISMVNILRAVGIGHNPHNANVMKGKATYTFPQLETIAEILGVAYEELVSVTTNEEAGLTSVVSEEASEQSASESAASFLADENESDTSVDWGDDVVRVGGVEFDLYGDGPNGARRTVHAVLDTIRYARGGMTWTAFAGLLGENSSTLSSLGNAKTYVDSDRIGKWAERLGVRPYDLFFGLDEGSGDDILSGGDAEIEPELAPPVEKEESSLPGEDPTEEAGDGACVTESESEPTDLSLFRQEVQLWYQSGGMPETELTKILKSSLAGNEPPWEEILMVKLGRQYADTAECIAELLDGPGANLIRTMTLESFVEQYKKSSREE